MIKNTVNIQERKKKQQAYSTKKKARIAVTFFPKPNGKESLPEGAGFHTQGLGCNASAVTDIAGTGAANSWQLLASVKLETAHSNHWNVVSVLCPVRGLISNT